MSDENIVKKVCKDLGLTYKQLGEAIGYSESSLSNAVATDKVSKSMQQAIKLYLENIELKKDVQKLKDLKKLLQDILK